MKKLLVIIFFLPMLAKGQVCCDPKFDAGNVNVSYPLGGSIEFGTFNYEGLSFFLGAGVTNYQSGNKIIHSGYRPFGYFKAQVNLGEVLTKHSHIFMTLTPILVFTGDSTNIAFDAAPGLRLLMPVGNWWGLSIEPQYRIRTNLLMISGGFFFKL